MQSLPNKHRVDPWQHEPSIVARCRRYFGGL
jgi:hypothetical protein